VTLTPQAYVAALLARRWYSHFELDQALMRRGVEEQERKQVLDEYIALGFINDTRFASEWVRSRDARRPRAAWVLRQELQAKGVADADITAAFAGRSESVTDSADQLAANALAEKILRRVAALPVETQRRRLWAALARRGFSPDVVRVAARHVGLEYHS
jgi:regulatory protein